MQVLVESRGITQVHLENNINVKCKDARHAMSNFRLQVKNTSDNIKHGFVKSVIQIVCIRFVQRIVSFCRQAMFGVSGHVSA